MPIHMPGQCSMETSNRKKIEQSLHEAQEALRESEERFRALLEKLPVGVFAHDFDGNLLMLNEVAARCTGYSRQELLSMSVADIDPGSVSRDDRMRLWHRLGEGEPITIESTHIRKDGTRYPVEVHLNAVVMNGRKLILGVIVDITSRKTSEAALRESEERLRLFIEHAPAALAMLDRDMRYLSVSRRWLSDYNLEGHELIGLSHYEVFPEIPEYWKTIHRRALAGEVVRADGDRFERADGSVQWLRWEVRPWLDHAGDVAGIVVFSEDITASKRAEEALQELTQTLEARVVERTMLAEARTRQLQALAVELIEAEEQEKQRIAGLLHEDLQQLLAAARFTLQSKRRSDPDLKEVQRLLEESIRKSRNLSHELSPAVLHHSDLTTAFKWLCLHLRERFGLNVLLDEAYGMRVESTTLKVFLFRAVQELLFNTVKHAGVNTAHVQLTGSDAEWVLTVCDSGKGFDPAILETYTPKSGLGLLSLRERASYIGGSLMIESTPGQGSRFILKVPVDTDRHFQPVPQATTVQDAIHIPAGQAAVATQAGIRVLFADDHKVMRQGLIRLVAGKPGISVVGEAANGREALEKVRQSKPDVVVMDISMPIMDGIEATRHIKAELPGVHVIGLSMHEDEHISRNMREAGAEVFLSKAASSSELLNAIYQISRHAQQGTPSPSGQERQTPTQLELPWHQ
jgi:PAS domain S-box-containing protein